MVAELFAALSGRRDLYLGSADLLRFAQLHGFAGGAAPGWPEEYSRLCARYDFSATRGADYARFARMVNDERGVGYCTDRKLHTLLSRTQQAQPALGRRADEAVRAAGEHAQKVALRAELRRVEDELAVARSRQRLEDARWRAGARAAQRGRPAAGGRGSSPRTPSPAPSAGSASPSAAAEAAAAAAPWRAEALLEPAEKTWYAASAAARAADAAEAPAWPSEVGWLDGPLDGFGVAPDGAGSCYHGQWVDGRRQGHGVLSFAEGVYEGQWVAGAAEGLGTVYFKNGDRFVGRYAGNRKQGRGAYAWADGTQEEGDYERGAKAGWHRWTSGDRGWSLRYVEGSVVEAIQDQDGDVPRSPRGS